MNNSQIENISALAKVPEHSITLMSVVSGGEPMQIGNYIFYANEDWLMGIGWPLIGKYNFVEFKDAFEQAKYNTKAKEFYLAAPDLAFTNHVIERDRFYILSANAEIPKRLKNPINHARQHLTIREDVIFTAQHRKLWFEFLDFNQNHEVMTERVRQLYLKTPQALALSKGNLKLLDAVRADGSLAASLLLDYSAKNFISYIIGAHSRSNYTPHASDLLFAALLEIAKKNQFRFIHLGLGINPGILRFKLKWGAVPSWRYEMAQWSKDSIDENITRCLIYAIMHTGENPAKKIIGDAPLRKPFAMLWEVSKNDKKSWLAGTAHFFCYSFEPSFKSLFKKVDNVIFEGPLDEGFMSEVEKAGKIMPGDNFVPLLNMLDEKEINTLENVITKSSWFANKNNELTIDIRDILKTSLPWHAFFTLWTTFLARLGWKESVDMEAWKIANKMKKNVIAMESLNEQLESLNSLPITRVLNFFRDCKNWKRRAVANRRAYLAGDLEKMMGSSAEFPTRTEHIISRRDYRFSRRMMPWLNLGNSAIFVGCAHVVNLRHILASEGFTVKQSPFGIWPKIHCSWRKSARPDEKVTW